MVFNESVNMSEVQWYHICRKCPERRVCLPLTTATWMLSRVQDPPNSNNWVPKSGAQKEQPA